LAIEESKAGIAGGGEAEKRVGPVTDGKNFLSMECTHVFNFSGWLGRSTNELLAPAKRIKPLQRLRIWRFHYADIADSQLALMRNGGAVNA
jgi:hypothetical protein